MTEDLSSHSVILSQGEKGVGRSAPDARQFERLRWRCRRGLLELDLTLQDFLERAYRGLDPDEQISFDRLLALPDNTLLAYLQGSENPPDTELMQLVEKIRQ